MRWRFKQCCPPSSGLRKPLLDPWQKQLPASQVLQVALERLLRQEVHRANGRDRGASLHRAQSHCGRAGESQLAVPKHPSWPRRCWHQHYSHGRPSAQESISPAGSRGLTPQAALPCRWHKWQLQPSVTCNNGYSGARPKSQSTKNCINCHRQSHRQSPPHIAAPR